MSEAGQVGGMAVSGLAAGYGLADADLVAMYRTMALARAID